MLQAPIQPAGVGFGAAVALPAGTMSVAPMTAHANTRFMGASLPGTIEDPSEAASILRGRLGDVKSTQRGDDFWFERAIVPVARVASDVDFHEQADLTEHFKRNVRTTPARYRAARAERSFPRR
jgi:AraC-like DNA-binding protein